MCKASQLNSERALEQMQGTSRRQAATKFGKAGLCFDLRPDPMFRSLWGFEDAKSLWSKIPKLPAACGLLDVTW
jgi:hypothetical protein